MALQFKSATGFDYVSAENPLPVTVVGGTNGAVINGTNPGAVTITAGGTNQSITFAPSGTGILSVTKSATFSAALTVAGSLSVGGSTLTSRNIITRTGNGSETAGNTFSLVTNEGATGLVTRTLPTAVAGYQYTVYCQDGDGIALTAASGDTIRIAGSVTAAAGTITSTTVGSSATLVAINATEWVAIASTGSWTF